MVTSGAFGSTLVPAAGSVRITAPPSTSASNSVLPVCGVKPAAVKAAVASSARRPRRSGTVSDTATSTVTREPLGCNVPTGGSVPMTVPGSSRSLNASRVPCGSNPSTISLLLASSTVLPATDGTVTGSGPFDTTRVTVAAGRKSLPGRRIRPDDGAGRHRVVVAARECRRPA